MKKILSHISGIFLALLIIHPIIDYRIPMMVNSWHWLYLVIASSLFGFYLLWQDLSKPLKILAVYLFVNAFFSQVPYLGFNAYIVIVFSFYFYLLTQKCEADIILRWIETAFWVQVALSIFQIAGMDKLLCFDRAFELDEMTLQIRPISQDIPRYVMFGTVMQYMRYASLLAVMSPFLILKNKKYAFILIPLCLISESSTFALSLITYFSVSYFFKIKNKRNLLFIYAPLAVLAAGLYAAYDWGSFRGAIIPSNGGRLITWLVILKTWVMDTAHAVKIGPWDISGPFNWQWFLMGHGIDTFLPLFPIYKHDLNPFPQAHNSWLQMAWETGLIGAGLIIAYCASLVRRLYRVKAFELIAGLSSFGVNMFFAFPDRMMQTCLLLVYYLAYCEVIILKRRFYEYS